MIELTIEEAAKTINAQSVESVFNLRQKPFPPVSIDSRTIQAGQCFIAIKGDRFDGHDFIEEALEKGATIIIHSRAIEGRPNQTFLQVDDTTAALQLLAHYARQKWGNPLVAITGSTGKTTTKEFTAILLSQKFRIFKSQGNLNNDIGVPLSLLELTREHELAVLELGMNHPGEVRRLGQICAPDSALITNVAPVHLEFFPNLDAIAAAKAEILESLPSDGAFFFNADDERVTRLAASYSGKKVSFGVDGKADLAITRFNFNSLEKMDFEMEAFGQTFSATVPFVGKHFLYNVAAASAIAFSFGLNQNEVLTGIAQLRPMLMRGRVFKADDITIWDDSYNSNPQALASVLETVGRLNGYRRKILALGEMLELGPSAPELHRQMGAPVAASGADLLVTVGRNAAHIGEGTREQAARLRIVHFEDSAQAADFISGEIQNGDFLLVKGSRAIRMDRIIERIEEVKA